MSDVFAQVTMCKRNRRPPLLYVVSFGTICLVLLLKGKEKVTNVSQKMRLQAPQLDCNGAQLSRLALAGSNELKTIYLCRVVTLVMALAPAHQTVW